MSEYTIYHNPRCSKSRQTLEILQNEGINPSIVEYLKTPLTLEEVQGLLSKLDTPKASLVRQKEDEFKLATIDLEDEGSIAAGISKYPKLLERPIVVKGNRAVIGRPPEKVRELF